MADEILVVEETELLQVSDQSDLLVEAAPALTELLEVAQQGPPGLDAVIRYTATTALSGHLAIVLDGAGQAVRADAATPAHFAVAGITVGASGLGELATVVTTGIVQHNSWAFTTGSPVFLGLAGAITQALPATAVFTKVLGVAVSPTSISVDFQPAIFK